MTPSADIRIGSLLRAMRNLVLPALDDSLATEAAQLVIGHLQVLRDQIDHMIAFERVEHDSVRDLATRLAAAAEGDPSLQPTALRLSSLAAIEAPALPSALRASTDMLNLAVIELLDAARGQARDARPLWRLVLRQGLASANRHRSWFAGMGFEDPSHLQSISEMVYGVEEATSPRANERAAHSA